MKTILFVSELGAGLGHIVPLLCVADKIQNQTASKKPNIIFVVKNNIAARKAFGAKPYKFLPAPEYQTKSTSASHSSSYAENLSEIGYTKKDDLVASITCWDDLFAITQPDLIIAEHSPTACLAAREKVPVMLMGSGYTMPPTHTEVFPALKTNIQPPSIHSIILKNINEILEARNVKPIQFLPQLLETQKRYVFTLPALDPYVGLRNEPLLGTYNSDIKLTPCPKQKHIFLYAGAAPERLDVIVQSIAKMGVQTSAYLGKNITAASEYLKAIGTHIYEEPPKLSNVFENCSMVISHGGAGLTTAAAIAGRPQLILPIHNESLLTAGRIEKLGLGLAVEADNDGELPIKMDSVLNVGRFSQNAQNYAKEISNSNNAVQNIAATALKILKL